MLRAKAVQQNLNRHHAKQTTQNTRLRLPLGRNDNAATNLPKQNTCLYPTTKLSLYTPALPIKGIHRQGQLLLQQQPNQEVVQKNRYNAWNPKAQLAHVCHLQNQGRNYTLAQLEPTTGECTKNCQTAQMGHTIYGK